MHIKRSLQYFFGYPQNLLLGTYVHTYIHTYIHTHTLTHTLTPSLTHSLMTIYGWGFYGVSLIPLINYVWQAYKDQKKLPSQSGSSSTVWLAGIYIYAFMIWSTAPGLTPQTKWMDGGGGGLPWHVNVCSCGQHWSPEEEDHPHSLWSLTDEQDVITYA